MNNNIIILSGVLVIYILGVIIYKTYYSNIESFTNTNFKVQQKIVSYINEITSKNLEGTKSIKDYYDLLTELKVDNKEMMSLEYYNNLLRMSKSGDLRANIIIM
jgi:cell shape-determining protein MreC